MGRYEVYVHLDLLRSIPRSGNQRRRIMDYLSGLREHPDTRGDYTDKDSSLRERQIKIVGDYAITFWLDSPVKIVMVVDIRHADT